MDEILKILPPHSFVLDLGAQRGSFASELTKATAIRLDYDPSEMKGELVVRGDAARLPFKDNVFKAIVANHSLEHFENLGGALREIGRVVRADGALFISVPDATTFTDRLYRWLARGGGHVNAFTSPIDIARLIEQETRLVHVATRTLCSSLSFLNQHCSAKPRPLRLILLGGGSEWSLFLYVWFSRIIDRLFGCRLSIYGWALYFGNIPAVVDTDINTNVCIRCGSGCPSAFLKQTGSVPSTGLGIQIYRCPRCSAANPYTKDVRQRVHA